MWVLYVYAIGISNSTINRVTFYAVVVISKAKAVLPNHFLPWLATRQEQHKEALVQANGASNMATANEVDYHF